MCRNYTLKEQATIASVKESHPHICFYCKKVLKENEITVDHVLPLNRGGKTEESNLIIACEKCNSEKSDMTLEEYMQFLKRRYDAINPVIYEINDIREQIEKDKNQINLLDEEIGKLKLVACYINALHEKRKNLNSLVEINIEKLNSLEKEKKVKTEMQSILTKRLVGKLNDSRMQEEFINNVYNNISIIDTTVTINLS